MNTLKTILAVLVIVAFFHVVGLAGSIEHNAIGLTEGFVKALIWLGIGGVCVYALNRLDD